MLPGLPFIFRLFRIPSPQASSLSPSLSLCGLLRPVHGIAAWSQCFSSTRSWNTGSQNTQRSAAAFHHQSTASVSVEVHYDQGGFAGSQLSWDTCTLWACSRRNAPPRCICCKPCATLDPRWDRRPGRPSHMQRTGRCQESWGSAGRKGGCTHYSHPWQNRKRIMTYIRAIFKNFYTSFHVFKHFSCFICQNVRIPTQSF